MCIECEHEHLCVFVCVYSMMIKNGFPCINGLLGKQEALYVCMCVCVNVIRKLQEGIKWMNSDDGNGGDGDGGDRNRLTENENVTKHSDSHAISKACLFYPVISHYIVQ